MARGRHSRLSRIGDREFETFTLSQTNRIKSPDTFQGISTFEYVVRRGDRLDHLAARYLNDEAYWWTIALVNNIVLPFIEPGTKLRIPFDIREVLDRL